MWTAAIVFAVLLLALLGAPTEETPKGPSIDANQVSTPTTIRRAPRGGSDSRLDATSSTAARSAHDGDAQLAFSTGVVVSARIPNDAWDFLDTAIDCDTVEALLPLTMAQIDTDTLGTRGMLLVHCATLDTAIPRDLSDGIVLFDALDLTSAGPFDLSTLGTNAAIGGPLVPWWAVAGAGAHLASGQLAHLAGVAPTAGGSGSSGLGVLSIRPPSSSPRDRSGESDDVWPNGPKLTGPNPDQGPNAGRGPQPPITDWPGTSPSASGSGLDTLSEDSDNPAEDGHGGSYPLRQESGSTAPAGAPSNETSSNSASGAEVSGNDARGKGAPDIFPPSNLFLTPSIAEENNVGDQRLPEPALAALLAAGVAMTCVMRRRSSRRWLSRATLRTPSRPKTPTKGWFT